MSTKGSVPALIVDEPNAPPLPPLVELYAFAARWT
jgi:hypothetical protein